MTKDEVVNLLAYCFSKEQITHAATIIELHDGRTANLELLNDALIQIAEQERE